MGQFGQTNDLQEAIDQVVNKDGSNAIDSGENINNIQDQLGVPPSPDSFSAPEDTNMFSDIMPPSTEELDSSMPTINHSTAPIDIVNPAPSKPIEDEKSNQSVENTPSAEQILSQEFSSEDKSLESVRENILRDLVPLMSKVQGTAEEKFGIYEEAINTLNDKKLVSEAYDIATQITDETKRAESLLKLMQAIDK